LVYATSGEARSETFGDVSGDEVNIPSVLELGGRGDNEGSFIRNKNVPESATASVST
jgi:hypothetical protein